MPGFDQQRFDDTEYDGGQASGGTGIHSVQPPLIDQSGVVFAPTSVTVTPFARVSALGAEFAVIPATAARISQLGVEFAVIESNRVWGWSRGIRGWAEV